MPTLPIIIGQILLEGMELWTEERKHRFQKMHATILSKISVAENAEYPVYTDAALTLAKEELDNFYLAYYEEVKHAVSNINTTN